MTLATIEVEQREDSGKNVCRRLRAEGLIPAVVYGGGLEPFAITVDRTKLRDLLSGPEGSNRVFLLKRAGSDQERHAMIREMQVDPISRKILHVDFLRIILTEKVKVQLKVTLTGDPVGVRTDGGIMDFVTREVEVECLPGDIPPAVFLDISELHAGQHVSAGDLEIPEKLALLEDPARVIVSIEHRRVAEEGSLEEELEEGEEGLVSSGGDEPEVIRRGKSEEETEG